MSKCCSKSTRVLIGDAPEPEPLETACGLEGEGTAAEPLEVATSGNWGNGRLNFPCDDLAGEPIYCDDSGSLRTTPPRLAWTFREAAQETVGGPPGAAGTQQVSHDISLRIENPSDCRQMATSLRINVNGIQFIQTASNNWSVSFGASYGDDANPPGPPGIGTGLIRQSTPSDLASPTEIEFAPIDAVLNAGSFQFMLPPGGHFIVRAQVGIHFIATNLTPGANGQSPEWRIREALLYTWGHNL